MGTPVVDFLVIGAMKCGTTSLHHYLRAHPMLALAPEKEVNFFFGDRPGGAGNHWRGLAWYRDRFPAGAAVRGEVSPGYTSPDHPDVAARIAALAPQARLLYLVRDPLARAVSQYQHHRRDGTEPRDIAEALLDPRSHYVRRSRFAERLDPFLQRFDPSRIGIVRHEDLLERTEAVVVAVHRFLGVDPTPPPGLGRRHNAAEAPHPPVPAELAARFGELVADDAARFERLCERLVRLDGSRAQAAGRCASSDRTSGATSVA